MSNKRKNYIDVGSITGGIIASYLSWAMWKSVGWAVIAFIFNWFYVLYYLVKYGWPA